MEDRTARLWTPERVPLVVPLAGLGERALAYLIDLSFILVVLFAGFFVYNFWGDIEEDLAALSGAGTLLLGLLLFGFAILYDVLFEVFGAGRTLGKRMVKLRVLHSSGRSPDVLVSILRNVLRLVDIMPFGYGVGIVTLFMTGTRRLGDLVADTFVVTERSRRRDPFATARAAVAEPASVSRPWSDAHLLVAISVVERTAQLDPKLAATLAHRALTQIDGALAADTAPADARAVLAGQILAHASASTGMLAQIQRLVEAESALASSLELLRQGSTPEEVERVDHAIRRGASELMRAARRDIPARHLESLSLALLDAERRRVARSPLSRAARQFLFVDVPSTVWAERALVARAGAVLALGLFVGGAIAYMDAEMALVLVGTETAGMIENGATWTNSIEQNGTFAQMSAAIILNNVFVGLRVFALGVLGGIATILGLLSNGLSIGATFGYALKLGTADTLLRFVLAHGPVELTMISVAGAGGMCLGRALLSPGRRTRLQALREEGARGVRLVVAASIGFAVIGTVEGFVSPGSMFPWFINAFIGLALLALFWLWVRSSSTQQRA